MSEGAPAKKDGGDFDVVFMHGATDDGEGARVLRARPGRVESGEVRPMQEGRPLVGGGEVVRLERRKDIPALYDVRVECKVPEAAAAAAATETPRAGEGPPQVATRAYRDSWERTFGRRRKDALN
jgi:hypothetical protein